MKFSLVDNLTLIMLHSNLCGPLQNFTQIHTMQCLHNARTHAQLRRFGVHRVIQCSNFIKCQLSNTTFLSSFCTVSIVQHINFKLQSVICLNEQRGNCLKFQPTM